MWFIPVATSIAILLIFWLVISSIYKNAYIKNESGVVLLDIASEAKCFSHTFDFSPKFLGLKYHLIIKFIVFLICSLTTHFSDSLGISSIVLSIVTFIHLSTFNARRKEFKYEIKTEETGLKKDAYYPIFKGYIVVTVYQIILYFSNFIVYLLNHF